jgi:hypothetical protein
VLQHWILWSGWKGKICDGTGCAMTDKVCRKREIASQLFLEIMEFTGRALYDATALWLWIECCAEK